MFKDELRALHDAVPLGQVKETLAYLTKENRFKSVKELDIEYMKLKSGNVIFIDVINADKIFTISGELIGIPSDELKSKLYQPFVPGDAIRAGDTLAIHIPGLTPLGKPAQEVFLQAGNQPPVPGLPFQVASDGSVVVPQIGKVVVVDQTLDQTRDALISRLDGLVTESQKKSVQVHTLMYANQTLEVRRIFGPETGRDGGNAESDESASTNTSSSSSALLKESVYQGQDLESWLNVLEYETYSGKREEAADAITRMINLKNRELVAERTASILEKNASYLAVKVLAEATGDQFFYKLTPILEKSEPKALTSILGGLSSTRIEIQSLKQIEPFLKWASSVIPKEASDSSVLEEAKNVFKAMIFYGNSRPAAQAAIIEQVDQWPNFTNENFWIDDLIKIETAWTPKLREVEARRIKEILQDKNSDKKLVAKALSMALFISNQDKDLIATMFRESPETVSNWLMPSPNFEEALQAREVDRTWGDVNRNENARLYPTLMLLDLLSVTGMGHEFRSELEKFHAAVPRKEVTDFLATSLAERRTSDRTVLIDNFNRFNPHDGPRVRLKNIETMHNKSGELLGISKEQLDSEIFPPMDVAKQIRPGDVLAINIPGLTPIPQSSKIYPPTVVLQAGKAAPVPGMPFIVDPSGNISLPSIGTISVEGKLVAEVVETIQSNPKYQEMYGSDGENSVDVNILMMVGRYQEVRQIMGPAVDLGESNAKANR
jgi:protein involved in polysaccharide export with SLBB domain